MTNQDSSPIDIVGDDGTGKAKKNASLRDVVLIEALKRVLGDEGRQDMFELVHKASQKGKRLQKKLYEHPLIGFIGFIVSIAIAIKIYFF